MSMRASGTAIELTEVPFFAQDEYQCGPAALATLLVHQGEAVTPDELIEYVYVPERRGSLQAEMLAASRRFGYLPYLLPPTSQPMRDALEAGDPVLLLQNLGARRRPVWHYAVLIGFDSRRERVVLRSGTERRQEITVRKFLRSWDRAGRWAVVLVDPAEPPDYAEPLMWLRAAAPFESAGGLEVATEAYTSAAKRWPDDARVWTALGNARYLQSDYTGAHDAYVMSLQIDPGQWAARNNLVNVLLDLGCTTAALSFSAYDSPVPDSMTTHWQSTLKRLALTDLVVDESSMCIGADLEGQR